MQILRTEKDLAQYLQQNDCKQGCLADTGFLYAIAFDDDRLFKKSNEIFELLAESNIFIYANVISRLEFVDLIFRKQVTIGCLELFKSLRPETAILPIFKLLKDIRDKDTAAKRQSYSYKIDESRLKRLRENIHHFGPIDWMDFCNKYVGPMLVSEWTLLEQELGLNFIEIMEGQTSDLIHNPLHWQDMVAVMGKYGLRGPDAMIVNLLNQSTLQLLITTDADFEFCVHEENGNTEKAVFIL